jgi:hypothetical protein
MELMIRLAECHPDFSSRTEMIRKWKRGQSMPNLKTVLETINYHNLSPAKLFPEVPHVQDDEARFGREE